MTSHSTLAVQSAVLYSRRYSSSVIVLSYANVHKLTQRLISISVTVYMLLIEEASFNFIANVKCKLARTLAVSLND